jgi:hypothetical protein
MKIITALKITIIVLLLFIILKSSKEGLECKINYKYLHRPLNDKLKIRDANNVIDCDNETFSHYFTK